MKCLGVRFKLVRKHVLSEVPTVVPVSLCPSSKFHRGVHRRSNHCSFEDLHTTHRVAFQEEAELEKDLDEILCGRRPRRVGEKPARMGNFVRLCPGTTAYRNARRLRRKVIRPRPGDDGDEPASNNPM